jgi:hypothetical protein
MFDPFLDFCRDLVRLSIDDRDDSDVPVALVEDAAALGQVSHFSVVRQFQHVQRLLVDYVLWAAVPHDRPAIAALAARRVERRAVAMAARRIERAVRL